MKKSIELAYFEIMSQRYELTGENQRHLEKMQSGYQGEVQFEKIVSEVLPNKMLLLTDLAFEMRYGETQIDALLISNNAIRMFEVKNLLSQYQYHDGVWTTNGWKLSRDYFTQMKRAGEILEALLDEMGIRTEVETKLVFIQEEDTVQISDSRAEGLYLKRWQIKKYFKELEKETYGAKWRPEEVAVKLMKRASRRKFPKVRPVDVDKTQIYRGIVCCGCGGHKIDVGTERYHVVCRSCGYRESKEKAVLRTLCDLAILDYDQPLTRRTLNYYQDTKGIHNTIRHVLKKYFKVHSCGRTANYINPMKRMEDAFDDLKFRFRDIP